MLFPLLGWTLLSGVFTRPVVEASVLNHHRPALSSGYSSAHSVQSPPWAGFDLDTNYYERIPNTGVVREFWFDIVNTTAAPDGIEREVLLVNGQFPGPTIEANWGDTIKVHVRNSMQNNGSAIHFHGVRQLYSNQMDGVQSLTQCPIAPGSNYTYTWRAEQYGSSWYHSHFSLQAWEGVLGGIVIHGPATAEYDEDLGIMMLNDWSRLTADQLYQSQLENGFSSPQMNGGLLNGTNTYIKDDGTSVGKRFKVESTPGKRYRLRLVNAAIHTHFKFSIDNHKMLVIANDFVPLEPFEVDYLPIGMGQRYDIIIEANQPIDNYWMRAVPQEACSNNTASENIKGILHYTGADAASEPASTKWNYADDLWCEDVPAKKLVPRLAIDPLISHATTFGDSIGLAPTGDPTLYLWTVGGQTFNVSWNNPTLLQTSESKYKTYGIEQGAIEINTPNQWTVFVIQTELPVPHPIHLHGHDFFILGQGYGSYNKTVTLNTKNPPRRDVAMLPAKAMDGGYLVIAFPADNPGVWLLHCHIGFHATEGFAQQIVERKHEFQNLIDHKVLHETCEAWERYGLTNPYGHQDRINRGPYDSGV